MTVKVKGLDQFQGKVTKFVTNAPKADKTIVSSVALVAKNVQVANARPARLSRFARGRGVSLKANYKVRTVDGGAAATIYPTPPGPWYLLEHGGDAHQIGRRRRSGGFLGRPGEFAATGPVQHPGSPPKRTWSNAVRPAIAAGQSTYRQKAAQTYLSMFR